MLSSITTFIAAWFAALKGEFKELYADAMAVQAGTMSREQMMARADTRGQLGFQTLIAAFTVVITGMAVVLVLDKFDVALGTPTNTDLSNSSGSLLTGFSSMVDLIEPLLLIAIVVVLIALVRRVG